MRDHLESELRQHGAALRALARDLVGAHDADDVVQETALAALRTPPKAGGSLGAWLAAIVRHVASRHRRTERRRARREDHVRRRDAVAADTSAHDGDTLRFLTDAVLALPQPYRAAVLARYLRDQSPSDIAAQSGEPVGTIKTRLKRGLALLRERFDSREKERGGDWRGAVVGAFGLERATAKVAATAAIGGIVMTSGMKWAIGVGAAALVAASVFVLGSPDAVATDVAPGSPAPPALANAALGGESAPLGANSSFVVTEPAVTPAERTAVATAVSVAACTVRGRVIDENGTPRAGVNAWLTGRGGDPTRIAEWTAQHGQPVEVDQRIETGADGAFVFQVASLSPFMFDLLLLGDGVATWRCSWNELAVGTTDLGDVVLAPGTLLRGRVVDADGAPVPNVSVRIERVNQDHRDRGYQQRSEGRTRKDGAFAAWCGLLAGDYQLGIDDHIIERPAVVALTREPEQFVDVVLKRLADADAICGVVVDDEGAPVRGASVHAVISGPGRIVSTDAEGRFRVVRREGMPDRVILWADAQGYDVRVDNEEIAWGRNDMRIVAKKGKDLVAHVVRAVDDAPVEDFTLRVFPVGGGTTSLASEPLGGTHHVGGRILMPRVGPGRNEFLVEPASRELATTIVSVDVASTRPAPIVVRLAATAPRTLLVQRADGSRVAGAKVQLVDARGDVLTERSWVRAPGEWWTVTGANKALVLTMATTDANGAATLRAPADRPLGLFLPGPGHAPHVVAHAVFPDDGPLVITVGSGATLRGTIGPETAFAEILRLARIDADEPATSRAWPSIYLTRGAVGSPDRFPDLRNRCAVKPDRTFEITGVPSGRWRIVVRCLRSDERGGSEQLEEDCGFVDLANGETVTRQIDLAAMLPGEIEGAVLHNGAPFADSHASLVMVFQGAHDGRRFHEERVVTDAAGRFRVKVRAGDYELRWMPVVARASWVTIAAAERVRVEVGQTSVQTFSLASGKVSLRVLDSAGKPVHDISVHCCDAGGVARFSLAPTDTNGRTQTQCAIEPFTMGVLPKRLLDHSAANAHAEARLGQADPFTDVRMTVGRFTPRAGETVTVEVRLPSEWER